MITSTLITVTMITITMITIIMITSTITTTIITIILFLTGATNAYGVVIHSSCKHEMNQIPETDPNKPQMTASSSASRVIRLVSKEKLLIIREHNFADLNWKQLETLDDNYLFMRCVNDNFFMSVC